MSSHPGDGAGPVQVQAGADSTYSVDARGGMGVQVGEGNTQIIYTYNRLTWTDGVAPPPLVSVSGVVDSPYRGLSAFEEQDAAFFFGREAAATECWSGCRGCWRARACWWCRVFRVRASRRCCGREYCRGSAGRGWRRRRARRRGRAWCSPRPARRWMSWRCGWRCWRARTRRRCGAGWTRTRTGSRSPPARPPSRRQPGQPGKPGRPGGGAARAAAAAVVAGGRPVRAGVHPVRR